MIRRRHATWALVAVGIVALAGRAGAAGIADYQLKNTGTTSDSLIVAEINPAGSVYAPTNQNLNPFKLITTPSGPTGTSVSSGFDPTGPGGSALDFVGTGTFANGDPLQILKLQFDNNGFAPGAVMNFSLALTPGDAAPTLTLIDPTTGLPITSRLSLASFTPPATTTGGGSTTTTTGGGGSTPSNNVPEPATLALWSVVTGLGLFRARAFRRARRIEG